jgi:soluble lytic murein transglycosylase-like protein
MKGFFLAVLFILSVAVATNAQTDGLYHFDNFDFAAGIRVQKAPEPTQNKTATHAKINRAPAANRTSLPLTKLTSMSTGRSLDSFTTGDSTVDAFIVESGNRNQVDPMLLYAVMHQESTFKRQAVSPKGARGLMQLMPGTAARFGVKNIFDPRQNIEGASRYIRFLLDTFDGDVSLALAGYNAGEGAVMKYGYRVPPYSETQEYVRRIGTRYALMRDPETAQRANRMSTGELAAVQNKESAPLTMYERSVYAVRMGDGRLQLVSQ